MRLHRELRSFRPLPIIVLALFIIGTSVYLPAQDADTHQKFHKFQPKVAPGQAAAPAARAPGPAGMSAGAAQQIQALEQEKDSRTPAQQKIDSNVLYTIRMLQGKPAAAGVSYLYTGVDLDENNNVVVDIVANVTDQLLQQLKSAGAKVLDSKPAYRSIRAIIPPAQMENIAASPDVIFISPMQEFATDRAQQPSQTDVSPATEVAPGFQQRAASVRRQLAALLPNAGSTNVIGTPITGQGSVETEGDLTHRAFDARGAFGIDGSPLKIGVLSNGVANLAASATRGDLPPLCGTQPCVTVLPGQTGTGDEGTAMLEIIHDMAPGATLYFATANGGTANFAQNIRNLRTAGCDIIVDDVFYFVETPFQDGQTGGVVSTTNSGLVTQAVNDVVAAGALYFSSAGNEGNEDDATSGTYEGDFNPVASSAPLPAGNIHNFGSTLYDTIGSPGFGFVGLWWSDPLGGSSNDYDLYVLDSTGTTVLGASTNVQNGAQDPFESVSNGATSPVATGNRLVVFQKAGANNRFIHIGNLRGTLAVNTAGETHGHSAASGAYTVAATPAAGAFGPGYPTGPFPNPFNSSNRVELFTSDGLRQIFFNGDSSAITPGNFSSTGGTVLNKPDITASDGVSVTGVGGFGSPFYGTSAAAPSAAAVAALVKSAKPSLTPAQIRIALTSTAVDIMSTGYDRDSGSGIVMAWEAVNSLGVPGFANPELGTITATENPGNGNGVIEAGEGAKLVIQLKNLSGLKNATGITAALTTTTAGVTITQPNTTTYADLAAGSGIGTNLSPLTFTLASNAACGLTINFTLTVTYTGGPVRTLNFTVQTGLVTFNNNLGTTPATIPGVTTATGIQTNRINRNGVPSTCGSTKAFPGFISSGARTFDSYTFTACTATCLSARLTSANAVNIFESAYSPSFVPANIATNYIGDAGLSNNGQTCSITTAASTPYTLVVNDVSGASVGSNYSLQLPICAFNCNVNQVPVALAHNVTVFATAGGAANASIDNGSSDPDGDPLTITQSPPGPYRVGTTNVLLTVVDPAGATAQASANVTVQLNPTTTTVSSSGTPSAFSTSVTFTANVVSTGGPVTPTGTVIFQDGSTTLGMGTLSGGVATFSTNALAVGSHSITAIYGGDLNCAGSTSPGFTQTVTGTTALTADISVTVTHSPNNPVIAIGGKLAITVTVTNNDSTNPAQVALNLSTVAGPFELDSVTVPGGGSSCNPPSGNAIPCSIPVLAANSNAVFTVALRPLFSDARTLTAIAAEASNTNDPTTADNTASDTIKVRFKPFRQ
jgi:hypothetical protein